MDRGEKNERENKEGKGEGMRERQRERREKGGERETERDQEREIREDTVGEKGRTLRRRRDPQNNDYNGGRGLSHKGQKPKECGYTDKCGVGDTGPPRRH